MNLRILLQATGVKGYQVFLLQVICQERKPQIDGWILGVVHILGPNIHRYSPKTEAINKLTATLYDNTSSDTS